ncbi:glycosyltransferase family 4 protein [Mucilaginibacter sp.]|uniref:glycosyltransferase family 4 protein n=1 Tax=Mucilaginibacter sp. TaxID=1882438 RepID=UPI0035BC0315
MSEENKRLSILIIPDMLPYPPTDGGKLCVFGLVDYLRKFHQIQMLMYAHSLSDRENINKLRSEWPDVVIHQAEIFSRQPKTKSTFKKKWKELFRGIKKSFKKEREPAAQGQGYELHHSTPFFPHELVFIKQLTTILAQNQFDIIQTEATHMLNLVNLFPAAAKKVYVQIEGRGEILYDYGVTHNFDKEYVKHVAGNAKFLEYAFMSRYDAVLALNETDRNDIDQNTGSDTIVYNSPFGILDAEIKVPDPDNYQPENLIFIGAEAHYPNLDALTWFVTAIVAEFETIPFKKLYVTGHWQKDTQLRLTKHLNSLEFIGFVDDLAPYLKNSVSISPVRIGGGGIRTKILSSMAQGVPVVATPLSAVGIKGTSGRELFIEDNAKDFASAISRLFADQSLAKTIGANAYQLVVDEYSQSTVGAKRNKIYQEICKTY